MRGNSSYCRRLEILRYSGWKFVKLAANIIAEPLTVIFNLSLTRKSLLGVGTCYLRFMGHCFRNNRADKALVVSQLGRRNGQQSLTEHRAWGRERKALLKFLARNSDFFISGRSPCEMKSHTNSLFIYLLNYFDVDLIQTDICLLSLEPVRWEERCESLKSISREGLESCYVPFFIYRYYHVWYEYWYLNISVFDLFICIAPFPLPSPPGPPTSAKKKRSGNKGQWS